MMPKSIEINQNTEGLWYLRLDDLLMPRCRLISERRQESNLCSESQDTGETGMLGTASPAELRGVTHVAVRAEAETVRLVISEGTCVKHNFFQHPWII